jgi:esterase/lipase
MEKTEQSGIVEQLQVMTDTVWGLETLNREGKLPDGEKINLLRTHYELQRFKEEQLEIPTRDRSFLYLQEAPTAAVLLVPGGHSTPAQYFHLGQHLYRSGMTAYCSLLPNEAAVGGQLGGVPWQLSLAELEMRYEMLALLGVPIHVVGSSFGGVLSLLVAGKHKFKSITLLSPPLKPYLKFTEQLALAAGRFFPNLFEKMISGSPHRWKADRYSAVRQACGGLGDLTSPLMAIHAEDNSEFSIDGLKKIRRAGGSTKAKMVRLEKGGHNLLSGPEEKRVQQEVLEFIQANQEDLKKSGSGI